MTVVGAVVALVLAATGGAASSKLTLHPAGFGAHSYSAWKAHQGLPDSQGNDSQALYFQKLTATATFAAGVAVIKGVAGLPANQLTGLAWDHREDGHCGAGAPRWNVNFQVGAGPTQTLFLGCNAAQHSEDGSYNGHGWCRDTFTVPSFPTGATITGLAIVFDEGNDTPNPPPAGCAQEQLAGGFVHLDNITVEINGVTHCWTSANDNGSGGASSCPVSPQSGGTASTNSTVPAGVPVDSSDTALVTALGLAVPGVALPSWLLYPKVVY